MIQAKSVPEKINAVPKKLSLKERKEKEEEERQVDGCKPEQPSPGQGSNPGLIEGPANSTLYCYCQKPSTKDLIGTDPTYLLSLSESSFVNPADLCLISVVVTLGRM